MVIGENLAAVVVMKLGLKLVKVATNDPVNLPVSGSQSMMLEGSVLAKR